MDYDPHARRDTPLARVLKDRIGRHGPISVHDYIAACLQDPEHGYYVRQPAIGAGGDFITAPEISQVFGELIGLWCAVVWQQMGEPATVDLVELGPGRGTLMRDALRAAHRLPAFAAALRVHLLESNQVLRLEQRACLETRHPPITWHDDLSSLRSALGARPAIIVANELLDALPTEQLIWRDGQWRRRAVDLDADGDLSLGPSEAVASPGTIDLPAGRPGDGDILEICSAHDQWATDFLARTAATAPLAALFIDYGHAHTTYGDTLQAVWRHHRVSPLFAPGETDLTTEVDFEHFARSSSSAGLSVDGPITQAQFLGRLGIIERASRLMASNPGLAAGIEAGIARLLSPQGMGARFKAIGIRSRSVPQLPGLV